MALVVFVALFGPLLLHAYPAAAGADGSYTILSGSMEPTIGTGAIIFTETVTPDQIAVGDIVTILPDSPEGFVYTHRVIEIRTFKGDPVFITKGDANDDPDPGVVEPTRVAGRMIDQVPYYGHLVTFAKSKAGYGFLILLPSMALILQQGLIVADELDRMGTRRGRRGQAPNDADRRPDTHARAATGPDRGVTPVAATPILARPARRPPAPRRLPRQVPLRPGRVVPEHLIEPADLSAAPSVYVRLVHPGRPDHTLRVEDGWVEQRPPALPRPSKRSGWLAGLLAPNRRAPGEAPVLLVTAVLVLLLSGLLVPTYAQGTLVDRSAREAAWGGAYAYFLDTDRANGTLSTAFSDLYGCVGYAGPTDPEATDPAPHLRFMATNATLEGCLHSDGDLEVQATDSRLDGRYLHNGTFTDMGTNTTATGGNVSVPRESYPWSWDLSDYAPLGVKGVHAQSLGAYTYWPTGGVVAAADLAPGLHYADGDLKVTGAGFQGALTIVATGSVSLEASGTEATPYVDGLLFASMQATGVAIEGDDGTLAGIVFAPEGSVRLAGVGNAVAGQLVGRDVSIDGQDLIAVARNPLVFGYGA